MKVHVMMIRSFFMLDGAGEKNSDQREPWSVNSLFNMDRVLILLPMFKN